MATRILTSQESHWTILRPAEMKSTGGAILTLQKDGSILVSGKNPDLDSYTLTCRDLPENITAVRLEERPHSSLPHRCSGRAPENGNFALSEWKVTAESRNPAEGPGLIRWKDAWSDYRLQPAQHYTKRAMHVGLAIDGDSQTYWESWPKSGLPHWAVFVPDRPIARKGVRQLKITLEFRSLKRHNLGRFRLSVLGDG